LYLAENQIEELAPLAGLSGSRHGSSQKQNRDIKPLANLARCSV